MAKTQDFSAIMKDMMGAFPVDTTAMDNAFKTTATLNEKLAAVSVTAAEKSAELSAAWTKDVLAKFADFAKAKAEPADYAKALSDIATASAEAASENVASFAEIAKKVQMDTAELLMAAGKDASEEAQAAVQKATSEATAAVQKATSEATASVKKAAAK
ncbi:phasin, PhaP [Planktotalea sp.]|uniref:phasin, PhaP n=1 Tax=Planktotalea sp. TaxID=2029877 RepID=UPI003D6BD3EB